MFTSPAATFGATAFGEAAAQLPAVVVARGRWTGGGFSPWFLLLPLFWILIIGLFIFVGRSAWRRNQGASVRRRWKRSFDRAHV